MIFSNRVFVFSNQIWGDSANRIVKEKKEGKRKENIKRKSKKRK